MDRPLRARSLPARELVPDYVAEESGQTMHFFSEAYLRELLAGWRELNLAPVPHRETGEPTSMSGAACPPLNHRRALVSLGGPRPGPRTSTGRCYPHPGLVIFWLARVFNCVIAERSRRIAVGTSSPLTAATSA
jgi:hypothetical protein